MPDMLISPRPARDTTGPPRPSVVVFITPAPYRPGPDRYGRARDQDRSRLRLPRPAQRAARGRARPRGRRQRRGRNRVHGDHGGVVVDLIARGLIRTWART